MFSEVIIYFTETGRRNRAIINQPMINRWYIQCPNNRRNDSISSILMAFIVGEDSLERLETLPLNEVKVT